MFKKKYDDDDDVIIFLLKNAQEMHDEMNFWLEYFFFPKEMVISLKYVLKKSCVNRLHRFNSLSK